MELIFEVIHNKRGGYTATCLNERIGVPGSANLRELHDNISDAVDARFNGQIKPDPNAIHLMLFTE